MSKILKYIYFLTRSGIQYRITFTRMVYFDSSDVHVLNTCLTKQTGLRTTNLCKRGLLGNVGNLPDFFHFCLFAAFTVYVSVHPTDSNIRYRKFE